MSARVKICGITDPIAFDAAVEAGADWLGFVFFPASPRYLTPQAAAALAARSPGGPRRVGLFVDPEEASVASVLRLVQLDVLQVYGRATEPARLRARFGLPVWQAVGVSGPADLPRDGRGADALVLEAKPPAEATRPGGNARSFDWSLLRGWNPPVAWILAGGLTPANVGEAIRETGAPSVDVSSGVERAPGIKEPALIRAFVANARSA